MSHHESRGPTRKLIIEPTGKLTREDLSDDMDDFAKDLFITVTELGGSTYSRTAPS